MSNRTGLICACVLMCMSAGTWANDDIDTRLAGRNDGDGKSMTAGFDSKVAIEAGDGDSKATIRIASNSFDVGANQYFRFSFGADAPFDRKKSDQVDIGTVSGLSSGTSATLSATWISWPKPASQAVSAATQLCEQALPLLMPGFLWKENSPRTALSLALHLVGGCRPSLFTEKGISAVVDSLNAEIVRQNEKIQQENDKNLREALEKCLVARATAIQSDSEGCRIPARLPSIKSAELAPGIAVDLERSFKLLDSIVDGNSPSLHLVSFGVTANRQSFSYVLPSAPADNLDVSRTGNGVTLGYTNVRRSWLWSIGYSQETSYEAGDETQICTPIGTTGSLRCDTRTLGAPAKKNSGLAFAEGRWMFAGGKYALSPRIEYDTKESEWAARVPLYLATNSKGDLTAGIAFGYTTKKDDFGIAVFVGKSFSFF